MWRQKTIGMSWIVYDANKPEIAFFFLILKIIPQIFFGRLARARLPLQRKNHLNMLQRSSNIGIQDVSMLV